VARRPKAGAETIVITAPPSATTAEPPASLPAPEALSKVGAAGSADDPGEAAP
jgi:hypothetical protein